MLHSHIFALYSSVVNKKIIKMNFGGCHHNLSEKIGISLKH